MRSERFFRRVDNRAMPLVEKRVCPSADRIPLSLSTGNRYHRCNGSRTAARSCRENDNKNNHDDHDYYHQTEDQENFFLKKINSSGMSRSNDTLQISDESQSLLLLLSTLVKRHAQKHAKKRESSTYEKALGKQANAVRSQHTDTQSSRVDYWRARTTVSCAD